MTEKESTLGLSCPNCGGMVPIPEGQSIVRCPFCDRRSFVKGERGLRRYQVPVKVQRESALQALQRFFSSNMAIARGLAKQSQLTEAFLVYLPFWTIWARVIGWAFGEKSVGSGDHKRYEPREVRLVQEMTWSGAACDVGEFGVNHLLLTNQEMQPFNAETLHLSGMVFEPANSFTDAQQAAEGDFHNQTTRRAGLDRLSQLFLRPFRNRTGLVYYPLWVLRYLYHGRAFQVVVDGYSGKVLYGKAPGNTTYRAAVLVLGMAIGAFLTVDVTAGILYAIRDSHDSPFWLLLLPIIGGITLMVTAYRRFRYGEQYEYRTSKPSSLSKVLANSIGSNQAPGLGSSLDMLSNITNSKDVEEWIRRLS